MLKQKEWSASLDTKYSKADILTITESSTNLDPQEINELYTLLKKYESLFDGNLGTGHGNPYDIKLKTDAEPYHVKHLPVPRIHELTFKQELDRLEYLKVIQKVNRSQWGALIFLIPKKDSTVRFISDFRELRKHILCQLYPIPKIQDLLLRIEGFCYGTRFDLNMGYYHIELSDNLKELCTIVTQWGNYEYQQLPMGLFNSPDIFQENMSELFIGLDTVRVYIDDLLHVTKGSCTEHLSILKEMFTRFQKAGIKDNVSKYC